MNISKFAAIAPNHGGILQQLLEILRTTLQYNQNPAMMFAFIFDQIFLLRFYKNRTKLMKVYVDLSFLTKPFMCKESCL